jgi:hypothetical protein
MVASLPSNAKVRVRASTPAFAVIGHHIGPGKSCPREVDDRSTATVPHTRKHRARAQKDDERIVSHLMLLIFQGMFYRGFVTSEVACEVDQDIDPTINAGPHRGHGPERAGKPGPGIGPVWRA